MLIVLNRSKRYSKLMLRKSADRLLIGFIHFKQFARALVSLNLFQGLCGRKDAEMNSA